MNHKIIHQTLLTTGLVLFCAGANAELPKCSRDHPGKQHRLESVAKQGDNRMTLSVAGHTTKYAMERFKLDGLVTQAEIDRVFHLKNGKGGGQMYNFLKWKLGSPSAVAGQFVTAGYQHYDRAYSDEAAAMLLGLLDFSKVQPEILVPEWFQDALEDGVKKGTAASIEALLAYLGVDPTVAGPLAEKVGAELAKKVSGQARKTVGVFIPKSFDFDNSLMEAAIKAKRPQQKVATVATPVPNFLRTAK